MNGRSEKWVLIPIPFSIPGLSVIGLTNYSALAEANPRCGLPHRNSRFPIAHLPGLSSCWCVSYRPHFSPERAKITDP
jgi:hypothetical protein